MRVDRCLTLGVFDPLRRIGSSATHWRLPILMYHSISDDQELGVHPYYRLATNPQRFAEHMQWLTDAGYRGVALEEALHGCGKDTRASRRVVGITFDDGFRNFCTEAAPVLKRYGFTASMYLPTSFISEQRQSLHGKECLTWDEVKVLRAQGIRFGSHTATHPKLSDLPWNLIEHEVTVSKACLEQELGEQITSFAYPYAFPQEDRRYSARFTDVLRNCGYRNSVTTIIGCAHFGDDLLRLRRLPVNSDDDRALFLAKLNGSYDWLGMVQRVSRELKRWTTAYRHRSSVAKPCATAAVSSVADVSL